jgi:U1 small nuclear ribonucleoprotein C
MPRFFDDYSNTYLTHDSSAGRKQQRRGWKFRENFRLHYQPYVDGWRRGKMGLAAAQQSYIKARGVADPAVPPLPDGWKEELDDVTGIPYYIDTVKKTRTWVRPGFIPPPPGGGGPQRGPPPPGSFQNRGPPMAYNPGNRGPQPPQFNYGGSGLPPPPVPFANTVVPSAMGGAAGTPLSSVPPFLQPTPGQTLPVGPPVPGGLPPPLLNLPPPPGAQQ